MNIDKSTIWYLLLFKINNNSYTSNIILLYITPSLLISIVAFLLQTF
jgi:hypothetical protein